MYNPFNHDSFSDGKGRVATESDEEAPRPDEATLLSVLEVGGRFYWRVSDALDSVGLTQLGYELLGRLRMDAAIELDRLADLLRRPVAELSPLVSELAAEGLVRADAVQGGPIEVTLTPQGSERAIEGRKRLDAVLGDFAARMGLEERVALARLLSKVER